MKLWAWDVVVAVLYALVVAVALTFRTDWAIFSLVGATVLVGVYAAWRILGGEPTLRQG